MKIVKPSILVSALLVLSGMQLCSTALAYTVTSTSLIFDATDQPNGANNAAALNSFISSLNGQTSSAAKSIYFKDAGCYYFEIPGDQLYLFQNVSNLTISGTSRSTWAFDVQVSWHCSNPVPQSFLLFAESCNNVEIKDILFTTSYNNTMSSGSHIKVAGSNFNIHGNKFTHCPGFALQFISLFGGTPTNNHSVMSNRFEETFADGVHVSAGNNINIEANLFMKTGDDAVAILGDDPRIPNTGYSAYQPQHIWVRGNIIDHSGDDGVRLERNYDVWVEQNKITATASYGIEITTIHGLNWHNADIYQCVNYAHINNNSVTGAGAITPHFYSTDPSIRQQLYNRDAINSLSAINLSINLALSNNGTGVQPSWSLVGYPPNYPAIYYSTSCTRYGVYVNDTLYGVIDNLSLVSGQTVSGPQYAGTNSTGNNAPNYVDPYGNTGLTLHNNYGY